jgi:ElaB/YqjD/DUF883 family membrane-anchored ribosome-binding protein
MERNENQPDTANEFSGSASRDNDFDFAGTKSTEGQNNAGLKDRAKNIASTAGDRLSDIGSTVRERASGAKDKLAGALESGAERLRERAQSGSSLAAAGVDASTTEIADGRMAQVSDKVAGGMETTAAWLRDADLESLKVGVERQVKEHPARTLLIAAGLGYLIGRAFKSSQ